MFKACVLPVDDKSGNLFKTNELCTGLFNDIRGFVYNSGFSTFFTQNTHRFLQGVNERFLTVNRQFSLFCTRFSNIKTFKLSKGLL